MDQVLSYDFDQIEYTVRQEIHATHGRLNAVLDELRAQMEASGRADVETMQMKEPEGIGGWNPLQYASADLGREIVAFCAARIGQKALDVLQGRVVPPAHADPTFLDNPGPTD